MGSVYGGICQVLYVREPCIKTMMVLCEGVTLDIQRKKDTRVILSLENTSFFQKDVFSTGILGCYLQLYMAL